MDEDDTLLRAPTTPADVLDFWRAAGYARWFERDDGFDAQCRARFLDAHFAAARRELDDWAAHADAALALVLLLDQLPRNLFRDAAHAFATDPLARLHAARAIEAGFDTAVEPALRVFFYLPFEHSEAIDDQRRAVELVAGIAGDAGANYLHYARKHLEVIERFGRFPHRNAALARANTVDEQAWLDAGGGF